jgi:predicted permease
MRWTTILRLRLRSLFARTKVEQELDEELRYHVERQIEEDVAAGVSHDEARRAAWRSIAGVEARKEECRDMRGVNLIDNVRHDARYALRQLRKSPGFTAATIFMLALGLCASVSIFAFVDAALIKPLPYKDSSRLTGVFETVAMFPRSNLSYLDYVDWKKQNSVFSSLDAFQPTFFILTTPAGAESARAVRVSDGFFRTLGVAPVLGRDFRAGEDRLEAPRTAILSYAAWQKRYGGDKAVLGQTVILNGLPNVIIGVMPPWFHFAPAEPAEFWTTLHADGSCDLRRSCHNMYGVGRLKDGVSVEAASANMQGIAKQLEQQYPDSNRGQGAVVVGLSESIIGGIRPILLMLLGGAGLLLLIAGVNVASLLLVRSESRKREMALRSALGASSARLVGQFVTEGVVLVTAGAAAGLLAAMWAMRLLTSLIPEDMMASMSYLQDLGLNGRVLTFAGAIALLAALLFSVTPTLRVSLSANRESLAEGGRGGGANAWRRLGSRLVVVELAIAMVLLVGAGLLGKSLYRLLQVDPGIRVEGLATLQVAAPNTRYGKAEEQVALQREVVRRLSSLPGVESVGLASMIPLSGNGNTTWLRVLGRPWHGEHNEMPERDVTTGYFKTLGAKLVRGRYFEETEDSAKPPVAIINQTFARQYFPDEDPLGKQLSFLSDPPVPIEIVGIVENIKEGPLDVPTPPVLYLPFNQSSDRAFGMVVRTTQAGAAILPTLVAAIREIDAGIVTGGAMTMTDRINNSQSAYMHRSSAWLVGGFAFLALALSVVGLYGVVAYSVSQRQREIGVRMALGAERRRVYQLILGEAVRLTAGGIVAGLLLSVGAATLMREMLFGVRAWDVPTLAAVAVVLGLSALLASYIPARRAASVNPVDALRSE